MLRLLPPSVLIAFCLLLGACGASDDGARNVVLIGSTETLFGKGLRISSDAQHLRGATVDGLVSLNDEGQVIPGLAERWIVTDDGRSYIFRLVDRNWPDGTPLSSETARDALRQTLRSLKDTSLGLDLAKVEEVRAMAGRVVEIRLFSPMPQFLTLLAQPELGLFHKGQGSGQMTLERREDTAVLTPTPPENRGFPAERGWRARVRALHVVAVPAGDAVARFKNGDTDIVLGGQIEDLPMANTGPLSRGTVRMDAVLGLFGLHVMRAEGVMAEPELREALAMAIDREAMVQPFNLRGWVAATRIVPPGLGSKAEGQTERWTGLAMEDRRAEAARRVQGWRAAHDNTEAAVSIAMPQGPGADIVFDRLRADLEAIGIVARRKPLNDKAQLRLVDRVARIAEARWFLNQFHCRLRQGLCSAAADERAAEAVLADDLSGQIKLLAEAEAELLEIQAYIPFGAPLRWSLVRGNVAGYAPNRLGFHPLPPLALLPR